MAGSGTGDPAWTDSQWTAAQWAEWGQQQWDDSQWAEWRRWQNEEKKKEKKDGGEPSSASRPEGQGSEPSSLLLTLPPEWKLVWENPTGKKHGTNDFSNLKHLANRRLRMMYTDWQNEVSAIQAQHTQRLEVAVLTQGMSQGNQQLDRQKMSDLQAQLEESQAKLAAKEAEHQAELSKRDKEKKEMVMSYEAKLLSETTRLSKEKDDVKAELSKDKDDMKAALSKEKDDLSARLSDEKEQMKLMYDAKLQLWKEQAAEQTVKLKSKMRASSNRKLQKLEQKVREYKVKVSDAAGLWAKSLKKVKDRLELEQGLRLSAQRELNLYKARG